mgnify:CR=1 FL=1
MKEQIEQIKNSAKDEISKVEDLKTLVDLKVKYLGKKGELTSVLRGMGALSAEERPVIGSLVNEVRDELETLISEKENEFKQAELNKKLEKETIDITQIQEIILPSRNSDNMCYYTCSILDNENHYLYAYASNASTRLIKFNIPDLQQDTVKLTDSDIIEYILVDHIDHQQGGIIKDGIFYMIYGVPGWGDLVWLRLFDLVAKKEIIRYNLSEKKFTGEPESIFFYKNELYAATNNSGIYKIMFAKKL